MRHQHPLYWIARFLQRTLCIWLAGSALTPVCAGQHKKEEIGKVGSTPVWRRSGETAFFFKSGMAVDADGSPHAYHPVSSKGLDNLGNAGKPGNWWALVTDNGKNNGKPVVQKANDPAPGYYISMTSLLDPTKSRTDPSRYVDAETIPYIVLPPQVRKRSGAKLGNMAFVVNTKNHKVSYAILADSGPRDKIGEGSMALAQALGLNNSPRKGGATGGIAYLVFPESGNGKPYTLAEIKAAGEKWLKRWGDPSELLDLVK